MTEREHVEVFDGSGELVEEFVQNYPKTVEKLRHLAGGEQVLDLSGTGLEGFVAAEDPAAELNEQLRRNSEGRDPAPGVSDAALWAEWTKHREAENG